MASRRDFLKTAGLGPGPGALGAGELAFSLCRACGGRRGPKAPQHPALPRGRHGLAGHLRAVLHAPDAASTTATARRTWSGWRKRREVHAGLRLPVCSPTRVSLMTGLNAARHRVTNWTLRKNQAHRPSAPDAGVPRVERQRPEPDAGHRANRGRARRCRRSSGEAGYRTIHVRQGRISAPSARRTQTRSQPRVRRQHRRARRRRAGQLPRRPRTSAPTGGRATASGTCLASTKYHGKDVVPHRGADRAGHRRPRRGPWPTRKPFFLYMSHYAVHVPIEADNRFVEKLPRRRPRTRPRRMYAAMVEGMDKSLGDILDRLARAAGVADNTIVLFMSDNGGLSARAAAGAAHAQPPALQRQGLGARGRHPRADDREMARRHQAGLDMRPPVIIEDFFPTLAGNGGRGPAAASCRRRRRQLRAAAPAHGGRVEGPRALLALPRTTGGRRAWHRRVAARCGRATGS